MKTVTVELTIEELEYLRHAMIEAEAFGPMFNEKKEGKKYSFEGYIDLYSKISKALDGHHFQHCGRCF